MGCSNKNTRVCVSTDEMYAVGKCDLDNVQITDNADGTFDISIKSFKPAKGQIITASDCKSIMLDSNDFRNASVCKSFVDAYARSVEKAKSFAKTHGGSVFEEARKAWILKHGDYDDLVDNETAPEPPFDPTDEDPTK